jgi:amino acid efflux transporter
VPERLARTIALPQGVALYVGAVIGAGVLLLPGLSASQAGPSALISWTFDCVLGIPLALTFAALAARSPDAGGVLTYATQAFGGAVGTVVGWFYFFAAATAQALVTLTGSYYIAPYFHLSRAGVFSAAGLILIVATAANLRGLRVSATLQLIFSATVALMLLVAILASVPKMRAANWTPFAPHGLGAIGTVSVTIFFAFFGWEAICHLSEEFKDPERSVPLSTAMSVGLISLLYVGIAVATISTRTYGSNEINRTTIAKLLSGSLGSAAGTVAAIIALLISLGTANAFVAATSRLGYAMSRDGVFPRPLARLTAKQIPTIAVISVGGWAMLCLIVSYVAGWDAQTLLVVPDSLVIIVYLSATVAAIKLFTGARRWIAVLATIMCCGLVPFAGVVLVIPAIIAIAALLYRQVYGRTTDHNADEVAGERARSADGKQAVQASQDPSQ